MLRMYHKTHDVLFDILAKSGAAALITLRTDDLEYPMSPRFAVEISKSLLEQFAAKDREAATAQSGMKSRMYVEFDEDDEIHEFRSLLQRIQDCFEDSADEESESAHRDVLFYFKQIARANCGARDDLLSVKPLRNRDELKKDAGKRCGEWEMRFGCRDNATHRASPSSNSQSASRHFIGLKVVWACAMWCHAKRKDVLTLQPDAMRGTQCCPTPKAIAKHFTMGEHHRECFRRRQTIDDSDDDSVREDAEDDDDDDVTDAADGVKKGKFEKYLRLALGHLNSMYGLHLNYVFSKCLAFVCVAVQERGRGLLQKVWRSRRRATQQSIGFARHCAVGHGAHYAARCQIDHLRIEPGRQRHETGAGHHYNLQ